MDQLVSKRGISYARRGWINLWTFEPIGFWLKEDKQDDEQEEVCDSVQAADIPQRQ